MERLILEAVVLDDGKDVYKTVGLNTVVAKRVELDAQISDRDGRRANATRLRADGDRWRFAARSIDFDAQFRPNTIGRTFRREFDFDYSVTDNFILSLVGIDRKTSIRDVSHVLPAASWRNRNWSIELRPDFNEDYRFTTRYNRGQLFGQYLYIDNEQFLSADYRLNTNLNAFVNVRTGSNDFDLYETGIDWYPNSTADLDSNIQASILANDAGDLGFPSLGREAWRQGFSPSAEIENLPPQDNADLGNETRYNLQLVVDYAYTGNQFVPGDSVESRLDSGSLSGEIITDGIPIENFGDLDIISVQIDGVRREVPLRGRSFFIDLVDTGIRRVRLDEKLLPIELRPDASKTYWVKISPGSVSHVKFAFNISLGFAGEIKTPTDQPLNLAEVLLYDSDGKQVASTNTDQFGLYRLDGIPPGEYKLVALHVDYPDIKAERTVTLIDSYIFDQNITFDVTK